MQALRRLVSGEPLLQTQLDHLTVGLRRCPWRDLIARFFGIAAGTASGA